MEVDTSLRQSLLEFSVYDLDFDVEIIVILLLWLLNFALHTSTNL